MFVKILTVSVVGYWGNEISQNKDLVKRLKIKDSKLSSRPFFRSEKCPNGNSEYADLVIIASVRLSNESNT